MCLSCSVGKDPAVHTALVWARGICVWRGVLACGTQRVVESGEGFAAEGCLRVQLHRAYTTGYTAVS